MSRDIVKGFPSPEEGDDRIREEIRQRLANKATMSIFDAQQRILSSQDAVREFLRVYFETFIDEKTTTGGENLPQGKFILAPNHPFGTTDMALTIDYALQYRQATWAALANAIGISKIFEQWEGYEGMKKHAITVDREDGESFGRASNGKEVLDKSIQFLRETGDGMLVLAPEGGKGCYLNTIKDPQPGMHIISHETESLIVPVLNTGSADIKNLRFNIKCQILPAFMPGETHEETSKKWRDSLLGNLIQS